METWKRQNNKLAAEWNVRNYESTEPDLPDYVEKKEREEAYSKKDGSCGKFFFRYSKVFKYCVSFIVVTFMVISFYIGWQTIVKNFILNFI